MPTEFNYLFAPQIYFAEYMIDELLIAMYQYEVQCDSVQERLLFFRPPYFALQYDFLFFLLPQNHDLIHKTMI